MAKLKQLPFNGDWIDPKGITAVMFLEGAFAVLIPGKPAAEFLPRVIVHRGDCRDVIECDNRETALKIRDEIAGWANDREDEG